MVKKKESKTADLEVPSTMNLDSVPGPTEEQKADLPQFNDSVRADIFKKRQERIMEEMGLQSGVDSTETVVESPEAEPKEEPAVEKNPPPDGEKQEATETVADKLPATEAESSAESPAGSQDQLEAEKPPEQKYKFVADGQTFEVTSEELISMAQRGIGAGRKFQEAAELRKQAEEVLFSQQNSQPKQVVNQNTPQQTPEIIRDDELRDIAKRMNYGSEDDQVKAIRDLVTTVVDRAGTRSSGPTPEAIVNVATQNALAVLTAKEEQDILMKEYPDILADIPLAHATDLIANQLAAKYNTLGQSKTRLELFREAGNEARMKYLQKPVPPATEQTANAVQPSANVVEMKNKIERKRTAPQTPAAANIVASQETKASMPSASQIVSQMRKARGQPNY